MNVGILGLQGCFGPHRKLFESLGATVSRVVNPDDIGGVDAMVLPGGESTTMIKTATNGLWPALAEFARSRPVWGVCAGCILLARHVTRPEQESLDIMDLDVVRNAYGAQNESFIARVPVTLQRTENRECVFIRAPRISRVGPGLRVNAHHSDDPVMVEDDLHMVTTFHPELTGDTAFHEHFMRKVRAAS
jgi:5'-phosphate synthase pdxT subunit